MPSTTPSLDPDRHTGFQLPATESVSHRIHPPAGARTASPTRRFPPRTASRGPGPPLRQRPDRDPPTHPPEPPRRCRPGKTHPGAVTSSSRSPAVPVPPPRPPSPAHVLTRAPRTRPGWEEAGRAGAAGGGAGRGLPAPRCPPPLSRRAGTEPQPPPHTQRPRFPTWSPSSEPGV